MVSGKYSKTIEDYLGVMYILSRDGEAITGVRLAELLGVSPPTVTNTLKRMVRDGLITFDKESGTQLTEKGLEVACSVMRRHMLTEWMLSRLLSWSKLHDEAHLLEHAISDEVEAVLLEDLNHPKLCPHGNPLPGNESLTKNWKALSKMKDGDKVIIRRIHELAEEEPQLLSFLEMKGIIPGGEALVETILPFNQTVSIHINGESVTLGFPVAKYIFVELSGENSCSLEIQRETASMDIAD